MEIWPPGDSISISINFKVKLNDRSDIITVIYACIFTLQAFLFLSLLTHMLGHK